MHKLVDLYYSGLQFNYKVPSSAKIDIISLSDEKTLFVHLFYAHNFLGCLRFREIKVAVLEKSIKNSLLYSIPKCFQLDGKTAKE